MITSEYKTLAEGIIEYKNAMRALSYQTIARHKAYLLTDLIRFLRKDFYL